MRQARAALAKAGWTFCLAGVLLAPIPAQARPYDPAALRQAAKLGDAVAAFELGTLDYVGISVVQDYIGAIELLKQAANAGNAEAACEAGFLYQTGSFGQGPPPPDPKDAALWYGRAAEAGNSCGEFGLAALLAQGQGVDKDPAQASALFAQAAAHGFRQDPASFPLQQLQEHFYALAYRFSGQGHWVDTVSEGAGGGG